MSKSLRRPVQIYAFVMWILSLLFAGMLIGLGALVIADLPRTEASISTHDFVDRDALVLLDKRLATTKTELRSVGRDVENATTKQQSIRADYQAARAALQAWLAARAVTEEDTQNPEVLTRTRAVEALRQKERAALAELEAVLAQQRDLERLSEDTFEERERLFRAAEPSRQAAQRTRDLKIFLYRLALTVPLLLAAGYFIARKRSSSYWPLYRGFVLFALFAFFVELVPYLPSYGGYVRYIVGVALILIAGHFLIRKMRAYLAAKQAEENRSEKDRRHAIEYETALKKLNSNTCPGCDRKIEKKDGEISDFCVHCGIRLQEDCTSCGATNISFHRFCLHCGSPKNETAQEEAISESG